MAADGLAQGAPQCGGFALPGARLPLRLGGDRMPPAELSRWWLDACWVEWVHLETFGNSGFALTPCTYITHYSKLFSVQLSCSKHLSHTSQSPVPASNINMVRSVALLAAFVPSLGMKCPGSPSWVHASAEVEGIAAASCQDVIEEIKARVTGDWQLRRALQHVFFSRFFVRIFSDIFWRLWKRWVDAPLVGGEFPFFGFVRLPFWMAESHVFWNLWVVGSQNVRGALRPLEHRFWSFLPSTFYSFVRYKAYACMWKFPGVGFLE